MLWYIIAPVIMTILILFFIKVFGSRYSVKAEEEKTEAVEEKMLSGRQRAQRIALTLIILGIIGKIARIAGGDSKIYMLDIILESLLMYWIVMYVGYPIARWIAGRWKKPKDEQKE